MINKSLLTLGHVINIIVEKEHKKDYHQHVPFRNSKLTFLLKDIWGGNSKTCLVATVSPSGLFHSETISTLNFAQRAKRIKNHVFLIEDPVGTVESLQAEVAKLRLERSQLKKKISSLEETVDRFRADSPVLLPADNNDGITNGNKYSPASINKYDDIASSSEDSRMKASAILPKLKGPKLNGLKLKGPKLNRKVR